MTQNSNLVTTITLNGTNVEFQHSDHKVVIYRYHDKKDHGLKWFIVDSFYQVRSGMWEQSSRQHMSETAYDLQYDWLTEQEMGSDQLLDPKRVTLKAFTALIEALV